MHKGFLFSRNVYILHKQEKHSSAHSRMLSVSLNLTFWCGLRKFNRYYVTSPSVAVFIYLKVCKNIIY